MFYLIGQDQAHRLRQAGVYAEADAEGGCIVARRVIKITDIFNDYDVLTGQGIGVKFVDTAPFATQWIYEITAMSADWVSGTVTGVKLGFYQQGFYFPLAAVAVIPVGEIITWSGSIFVTPGTFMRGQFQVTAAGAELHLYTSYIRSPYPS